MRRVILLSVAVLLAGCTFKFAGPGVELGWQIRYPAEMEITHPSSRSTTQPVEITIRDGK